MFNATDLCGVAIEKIYILRSHIKPTITHNKLVCDKIPEIITAAGKPPVTCVLSDEEYLAELDRKLNEECAEYQADKSIEEMADVLEVLYAIAAARGHSVEELERVRAEKAEKRGGFLGRIYLEKVVE